MRKMTIFRVTRGVGILNLIDSGGNHGSTLALKFRSESFGILACYFSWYPLGGSESTGNACPISDSQINLAKTCFDSVR